MIRKMASDDAKISTNSLINKYSLFNRFTALKWILFCYFVANKPIWNETYADALKRDLLMSYDKFARPTEHYNTTKVTLDLKIKHVDFDEATSIFTVYAWFAMVIAYSIP